MTDNKGLRRSETNPEFSHSGNDWIEFQFGFETLNPGRSRIKWNPEKHLQQRLLLLDTFKTSPKSYETAKKLALETLQVYTNLASELKLKSIKDKLEDAAFQILHPTERQEIISVVRTIFDFPGQNILRLIIENLRKTLDSNGIHNFTITGRQKSPFSIWQKMKRKNLNLEQIRDILGIRIVVNTVEECYETMNILHSIFSKIVGTQKDYIQFPKDESAYQSLHSSIIGPYQKIIEVQVRTNQMDTYIKSIYKNYWRQKTIFS